MDQTCPGVWAGDAVGGYGWVGGREERLPTAATTTTSTIITGRVANTTTSTTNADITRCATNTPRIPHNHRHINNITNMNIRPMQ